LGGLRPSGSGGPLFMRKDIQRNEPITSNFFPLGNLPNPKPHRVVRGLETKQKQLLRFKKP
jgi:hypothetical protein